MQSGHYRCPSTDEGTQASNNNVAADLVNGRVETRLPTSGANWCSTSHIWSADGFCLALTVGFFVAFFVFNPNEKHYKIRTHPIKSQISGVSRNKKGRDDLAV